jgi:hypothetical protein
MTKNLKLVETIFQTIIYNQNTKDLQWINLSTSSSSCYAPPFPKYFPILPSDRLTILFTEMLVVTAKWYLWLETNIFGWFI